MQDRYVGDIGDFAKYGLLRALGEGRQLGVAWYLHPDENHNQDGRHIAYLCKPDLWSTADGVVFEALGRIIDNDRRCVEKRSVAAVQASGILRDAVFADERFDTATLVSQRAQRRADWLQQTKGALSGCDVVFADPDNGLCHDRDFTPEMRDYWKRIPLGEALDLAGGRPAVIYHHNSRFKGGHPAEIKHWLGLGHLPKGSYAWWCRSYSPRTFFVINADDAVSAGLKNFVGKWEQVERQRRIRPSKRSVLFPEQ